MKRLVGAVAVLALVASCGSSNNGGNNGPVGSVAGNSLTINDAIYALDTRLNFLFLLASDRTGLCALFSDSNPPTGKSTVLIGGLVDFDGQSVITPVAGTYNWVSTQNPPTAAGKYAFSEFQVANGCTPTTQVEATGGTVTLGAVGANTAGSHTTGSFSLKFGADSLAGNLDATYCAALLSNNQIPVACP
jgi:hypothetical protein